VIGIGNPLRSDDGIGIHVIEALREEDLRDGVDIKEGLSGLDILSTLEGYEKIIIVDAMQSGGEPGTIHRLSIDDLNSRQTLHTFSTHDIDFPSMLRLGRELYPGKITEDIDIIAIEAEDVETFSEKCTPRVEKAVKDVVALIKGLL
jgi:hydrogenase maturation protease